MRYFLLFDDISGPQGDLYRWDGRCVRMMNSSSGDWSDHTDSPAVGETVEDLMSTLAGTSGTWEEVDGVA
jgi:hypothetical protein